MATADGECHPDPLRVAAFSTCPSGLWHHRIAPLLAAPDMVMLNIGANKGYNLVEFLQRYSAAPSNLTHAHWYRQLMRFGCEAQCCGVCASCKMQPIPQQANSRIQLHAFELQASNAALLRRMTRGLPVVVHSTGVSNASGFVYTSENVKAGSESFGILHTRRHRTGAHPSGAARPVTTIDAWMDSHQVPRAHFASIDTEGEDPLVLFGMERTLSARRIDVLEVEYNRKWKAVLRDPRPLRPVIDWLHGRGYTCFWQGNKGALAQLSGRCYREETRNRFGFARSNFVCTHRSDLVEALRTCQRAPLCKPRAPPATLQTL